MFSSGLGFPRLHLETSWLASARVLFLGEAPGKEHLILRRKKTTQILIDLHCQPVLSTERLRSLPCQGSFLSEVTESGAKFHSLKWALDSEESFLEQAENISLHLEVLKTGRFHSHILYMASHMFLGHYLSPAIIAHIGSSLHASYTSECINKTAIFWLMVLDVFGFMLLNALKWKWWSLSLILSLSYILRLMKVLMYERTQALWLTLTPLWTSYKFKRQGNPFPGLQQGAFTRSSAAGVEFYLLPFKVQVWQKMRGSKNIQSIYYYKYSLGIDFIVPQIKDFPW